MGSLRGVPARGLRAAGLSQSARKRRLGESQDDSQRVALGGGPRGLLGLGAAHGCGSRGTQRVAQRQRGADRRRRGPCRSACVRTAPSRSSAARRGPAVGRDRCDASRSSPADARPPSPRGESDSTSRSPPSTGRSVRPDRRPPASASARAIRNAPTSQSAASRRDIAGVRGSSSRQRRSGVQRDSRQRLAEREPRRREAPDRVLQTAVGSVLDDARDADLRASRRASRRARRRCRSRSPRRG